MSPRRMAAVGAPTVRAGNSENCAIATTVDLLRLPVNLDSKIPVAAVTRI